DPLRVREGGRQRRGVARGLHPRGPPRQGARRRGAGVAPEPSRPRLSLEPAARAVTHGGPTSIPPLRLRPGNGLETSASGSGTQVAETLDMARTRLFAHLALLVGSAIVLGCSGNVVGGGEGQGGEGGQGTQTGTQTDTGTTACTAYAGD